MKRILMTGLTAAAIGGGVLSAEAAVTADSTPRTLAWGARTVAVDAEEKPCSSVYRRMESSDLLMIDARKPHGLYMVIR